MKILATVLEFQLFMSGLAEWCLFNVMVASKGECVRVFSVTGAGDFECVFAVTVTRDGV